MKHMYIFFAQGIERGQQERSECMIVLRYTKGGTCEAFKWYSDTVIGRARGGGYSQDGVALQQALEEIYGIELPNGAIGAEGICREAAQKGVFVLDPREVTEVLHRAPGPLAITAQS